MITGLFLVRIDNSLPDVDAEKIGHVILDRLVPSQPDDFSVTVSEI